MTKRRNWERVSAQRRKSRGSERGYDELPKIGSLADMLKYDERQVVAVAAVAAHQKPDSLQLISKLLTSLEPARWDSLAEDHQKLVVLQLQGAVARVRVTSLDASGKEILRAARMALRAVEKGRT